MARRSYIADLAAFMRGQGESVDLQLAPPVRSAIEMSPEVARRWLAVMRPEQAAARLATAAPPTAARWLTHVPPRQAADLLNLMPFDAAVTRITESDRPSPPYRSPRWPQLNASATSPRCLCRSLGQSGPSCPGIPRFWTSWPTVSDLEPCQASGRGGQRRAEGGATSARPARNTDSRESMFAPSRRQPRSKCPICIVQREQWKRPSGPGGRPDGRHRSDSGGDQPDAEGDHSGAEAERTEPEQDDELVRPGHSLAEGGEEETGGH